MKKEDFAEIVLNATDSLYHVSKSILRDEVDCEDAVQETIAIAFSKLHTLRQEQYARTWLTKILIHVCYDILKKKKRTIPMYPEDPSKQAIWGSTPPEQEDYSELYEALMLLKKEYRLAIVLHYLEGYSVEETARILHISTGTVKSRLSRGRSKLRCILENMEDISYENIS